MQFLDYKLIKKHERRTEKTYYFELPEGTDRSGNNFNAIKVDLYYYIGGINYLSGNPKPRGYYVSLIPVKVEDKFIRSVLLGSHSGGYIKVAEVARFSKKLFDGTITDLAQKEVDQWANKLITSLKTA